MNTLDLLLEDGSLKIAMLEVDWKDSFSPKMVKDARREVGGDAMTYDFNQTNVDAKILFVSSAPLTDAQLEQLWNAGDLATGDQTWVGKDFDDVLAQVKAHAGGESDELAKDDGNIDFSEF